MNAPAQSWHASAVECDTCLSPPGTSAHGGTWHDGTHIIPTLDEDDEGTVGDLDGDGTTSSTLVSPSTSNVQPAQTSASTNVNTNNDDGNNDGDDHGSDHDDDDDGGDSHGGKGKSARRRRQIKRTIRSYVFNGLAPLPTNNVLERPFVVQDADF